MKITIDIPTEELIALQKAFMEGQTDAGQVFVSNLGKMWTGLMSEAFSSMKINSDKK